MKKRHSSFLRERGQNIGGPEWIPRQWPPAADSCYRKCGGWNWEIMVAFIFQSFGIKKCEIYQFYLTNNFFFYQDNLFKAKICTLHSRFLKSRTELWTAEIFMSQVNCEQNNWKKQCCGSGSAWIRNFCLDLNLELLFRIRIQQKVKEQINKTVKSGLFVL